MNYGLCANSKADKACDFLRAPRYVTVYVPTPLCVFLFLLLYLSLKAVLNLRRDRLGYVTVCIIILARDVGSEPRMVQARCAKAERESMPSSYSDGRRRQRLREVVHLARGRRRRRQRFDGLLAPH